MSCSFCMILTLQKYESSYSSHLIGSFSCSNGMIFECHLPEVISDLLIMLCFYIMKNWITSLFWGTVNTHTHTQPILPRLGGIHILHYCTDKRKRARISAPIILSKLLELVKQPLTGPSSLEGIIRTEIYALFLLSVQ